MQYLILPVFEGRESISGVSFFQIWDQGQGQNEGQTSNFLSVWLARKQVMLANELTIYIYISSYLSIYLAT